jgi:hypothetical protein
MIARNHSFINISTKYPYFIWCRTVILGAFAKLREATVSSVMFVLHPSARMEKRGSHWTDFHEIWNLVIFRKSVEKIQVSLKSDKNDGYFTWRPLYIYDHISLSSS